MMKNIFLLLFIAFSATVFSQDSLRIYQDSRLEALNSKKAIQHKKAALLSRNTKVQGYRIQVVATQNREEAFKVKAQLMQNYPSHKSYTIFQAPYFRVKIGNFTNREEAEVLKKSLSLMFKQNVYIVRDMVEYTPTEDELFLMQE